MENSLKDTKKRERKIIIIVFVVLLLVGILALPGYGIGSDENTEIDIARLNLKEYIRLFWGEGSRLFQFMDGKIGDLMDSVEIDHGEALLYPVAAVVSVLREIGRTDLGMYAYHMYLYIWFLIGLLALYGVGKYLTGKKRWGICAAAFVGLNPLIFGASFVNNKDVILMSLVSICLYTGIRFVEEKRLIWSVLWGIVLAFCINIRVIGLMYMGLFGLLYLLEFLQEKNRNQKVFLNGLVAVVTTLVVFIAITPATWYSLVGYFSYTLFNSVSFSRWNHWVLYCGELYNFLEKPLPWHYLIVCIAITTPLGILLSIILGQFYIIRELFLGTRDWAIKKYCFIFTLIVWVPMTFFALRGANVYDGWRHFYFIYPEMVLLAVCALKWLCGLNGKIEKIVEVGVIFQAVVCILLLILGHPFQEEYMNYLAKRPVADNFEYANTPIYKEALEEVLKINDSKTILISSDSLICYYGIKQAWEILAPDKKARIQIAEPDTEECMNADYHIYSESTLRKEAKMAALNLEDRVLCEPEKKFDSQIGFDAYGYRIITIYYNK